METKNNDVALGQFVGVLGEIQDRLDNLQDYFDSHMEVLPEDVHFGHVGTANYYLEQLTNIVKNITGEE